MASEEEKEYFFDALAQRGKTWEAEKKLIVDGLKTLQKFKPFDKVIVRLGDHDIWKADFYSHSCTNGEAYTVRGVHISDPRYILPYKGNEHLIGSTANNPQEKRLNQNTKNYKVNLYDVINFLHYSTYNALYTFLR